MLAILVGLALLVAVSACGGTSAASKPITVSVSIKNYTFVPAIVKIHPGDTIKWTNSDSAAHTVTSDPGDSKSFGSPTLNPGSRYSARFAKAGTFTYHCSYHSFMTGTIRVS